MAAAGALLLALFFEIGPDGWLLGRELATSELAPVRELAATAAVTWQVHHEVDAAPMAFYLEPAPLAPDVAMWVRLGGAARLLPRLAVPRLVLYAPYYRPPRPLAEHAVDTAEYLLRALVEARLAALAPDDAYLATARERAPALLVDLAPEERLPAYLAAAADFGAHVVGVANELGRAVARRRLAGRAPCPQSAVGLFARWPDIFRGGEFRGHLAGADGATRWSVHALAREDQDLLLRRVLGADWSGDVARDLPHLCPPEGGPPGSGPPGTR